MVVHTADMAWVRERADHIEDMAARAGSQSSSAHYAGEKLGSAIETCAAVLAEIGYEENVVAAIVARGFAAGSGWRS